MFLHLMILHRYVTSHRPVEDIYQEISLDESTLFFEDEAAAYAAILGLWSAT